MQTLLFQNKTIKQLISKYESIWALKHLSGLASWDVETYMPEAGAYGRGKALAKAASLMQDLFLDKTFVKDIHKASQLPNLNPTEQALVRVLKRELIQFEKLPKEFVENWQQVVSESQVAWRTAKQKNDYSLFEPYLEKIIDLNIRKADYLGYKHHPYDALLDEFEEGSTTIQLDEYFTSIKGFLQQLLTKLQASQKYKPTHPLTHLKYNISDLKKLNQKVLETLRIDRKSMRLDESTHPFTSGMGINDVRITTKYPEKDFAFTLGSTIHEFGHGLYESQINPQIARTPIGEGISLGIHESQSRFWENFVGRNEVFLSKFLPDIHGLSSKFGKYSANEVARYFNSVQPGLIRTEADEITYHFHIMIRYEIEKALISKELSIKDAPQMWKEKYTQYLGVTPQTHSEGILQDIHWSMGAVGYFPTYSTGTILSAQWKHHLEKDLDTIETLLEQNDGIEKIQNWLKDHIHTHGGTYTLNDLVQHTVDENFTTKYWKEYLEDKYVQLYS